MSETIKLIIADDEPYILGMLEKLIDFEGLGIELAGCAYDGETLENKIELLRPDIVLTDISMPKKDGLEVIRRIHERGIDCRFIIISGYRQFEYAYNALKYDVDDYLLKPVEKVELNRTLQRICDEIRHVSVADTNVERMRQHARFIEYGIDHHVLSDAASLNDINRQNYTQFQPGCFQMMMMKLDFSGDVRRRMEDVSSVTNKLSSIGLQAFQACCHEVVMVEGRERIAFVLNYDPAERKQVQRCLEDIYIKAKQIIELFHGFNLTLCIGKRVGEVHQLQQAKQSCQRACWLRLRLGVNRVIYDEETEDVSLESYRLQLDSMEEELLKACTAMDTKGMAIQFERFFMLPSTVLLSTEAFLFLQDCVQKIAGRYEMVTKEAGSREAMLSVINDEINMQMTFQTYREALVAQVEKYLLEMAELIRERNAKPVLRACVYIEQHFAEHITLETMANLVNLSPIYFSAMFKRETGKNFTEYLTEYRMDKAKEMLRTTDRNINEIADALGYTDARYFSKVFKKEEGIKPTDYRKIYG